VLAIDDFIILGLFLSKRLPGCWCLTKTAYLLK